MLLDSFRQLLYTLLALLPCRSQQPSATPKPRVVIVGAGFAGMRLVRLLGNEVRVTLIDSKDYFEYVPGILDAFAASPSQAARPLWQHASLQAGLPSGVAFVQGRVSRVDEQSLVVASAAGAEGPEGAEPREHTMPFDHLVLCMGSQYLHGHQRQSFVAGDAQIDATRRALDLGAQAAAVRVARRVLVIGGGLVGVELAAEIAHAHPGKEVVLAHNGPSLLHRLGLPASCHAYAMTWFKQHGVRVLLNARMAVEAASASSASSPSSPASPKDTTQTFRSECGTHKLADVGAVFWCTGAQPRTGLVRESPALGEKCLTSSGFVRVDQTMRVTGTSNVWALGDIADHPYEKQGYMAELTAEVAAANITQSIITSSPESPQSGSKHGAEMRFPGDLFWPRTTPPTILAISLGPSDGLLIFDGLVIRGRLARFAKEFVNVSKLAQVCGQWWGIVVWAVAHPITYAAHGVFGAVQGSFSACSGLFTVSGRPGSFGQACLAVGVCVLTVSLCSIVI